MVDRTWKQKRLSFRPHVTKNKIGIKDEMTNVFQKLSFSSHKFPITINNEWGKLIEIR